jgi:hypothetical protein
MWALGGSENVHTNDVTQYKVKILCSSTLVSVYGNGFPALSLRLSKIIQKVNCLPHIRVAAFNILFQYSKDAIHTTQIIRFFHGLGVGGIW